jgi:uncharacterized protein Yka (UPF0111/DUF47 family)
MMHILRTFRHLFDGKRDLTPFFTRQTELLCQCSDTLVRMLDHVDPVQWNMLQREIKSCETQGDALLQDFREQLSERLMGSLSRTDLSTIAMSMDDSLDVIKDAAKAVQIYKPRKIDQQLQDLAQLIRGEAYALRELLPLIWHIRDKASAISLLCDRVTEMEHAADDAYEEYIGYIFAEEDDMREMTKYKNLAETLEKATDSQKHVADCVRLMVMRFLHE